MNAGVVLRTGSYLLCFFDFSPSLSLDVLHLLADFFEFGFGFDDGLGDAGIVGLGADGVEFAEQFLAEEVERSATRGRLSGYIRNPRLRAKASLGLKIPNGKSSLWDHEAPAFLSRCAHGVFRIDPYGYFSLHRG